MSFFSNNGRIARGARVTEVRLVLGDVNFEVDVAVSRDVRRNFEIEFCVVEHGLSTGSRDDADRNTRARFDACLDVVERHDARGRDDLEEAFFFHGGEADVEVDGTADGTEGKADRATSAGTD